MKTIVYKILVLCVLILNSITTNAYDFTLNDLSYNILSDEISVELARGAAGDVVIPAQVQYNNKTYKVVSIGKDAFYHLSVISVFIPQSVNNIGVQAFQKCESLKKVTFEKDSKLKKIGNYAFLNCYNLESISLPEGLEEIGFGVLMSCRSISNIEIPESVYSIGDSFLQNCIGLEAIVVNENNTTYDSRNNSNAIIETSNNRIISACKNTIIPNTVITIGSNAFTNLEIHTMSIPNSVLSIEKAAFSFCKFLYEIDLPNSITKIGNNAFQGCTSITTMIIPPKVTFIGQSAFLNCSALEKVNTMIEKPFEINSNVFEGISSKAVLHVPHGTKNIYQSYNGWTVNFADIIEEEGATNYILSIKATGNGSASYSGTSIKNNTQSFTVNEETSATIYFIPDTGYKIKSVKVNGTDVTSNVGNNQYTISNITANTNVEVEFEAIPVTTYTLSITSSDNGSASYNGTTIRSKTSSFTVNEGTAVTITLTPDNGYRIKTVKENNTDVTSYVSNNKYTINSLSRNTTINVEFEAIPPTTYTLSIKAAGNGSATYCGISIKNNTQSFSVNEGTSATISFTPDAGNRIKSVKVNNTDVTSSVSNNQYTISNITTNTTIEVEFEAITYTLSISSTGNGVVIYNSTEVRETTKTFTVNHGSSAIISFSPDDGNSLSNVMVNNSDVTSQVTSNRYTISDIKTNTTLSVTFVEDITAVTVEGVNYKVVSQSDKTVNLVGGDYGQVLTVPTLVSSNEKTWTVVGVEQDALKDNIELAAIIWNPEVEFNGVVSNPNLLLYVKNKQYAPSTIKNVVVNGEAEEITLVDAQSGNNFYCPQAFTAKKVSYEHHYGMTTGYNTCQGWETIVLPFDVATILNATAQEIVPYAIWDESSNLRTFWLYNLTASGWQAANSIKANTPYIISMPNNENYDASYNITGNIQFIGNNVQIKASDNLSAVQSGNKSFVPNYQYQETSSSIYALNVNNQWNTNTSPEAEGSTFIRSLRAVRPFEAYLTVEGGTSAPNYIPLFGNGTPTGIREFEYRAQGNESWYTLDGRKLQGKPTSKGLYIMNGRKVVVK